MFKIGLNCVVVVVLVAAQVYGAPQQRRQRPSQQSPETQQRQISHQLQQQQVASAPLVPNEQVHNLDPTSVDEGMAQEHAKLVENLQRLKRTLDHVKERVDKGHYGETAQADMKNPEGAILTVLKSLQEQGQLFAMINDMLKAGSEVQNQTAKIEAYSQVKEQIKSEAAHADQTNQITVPQSSDVLSAGALSEVPESLDSLAPTSASPISTTTVTSRREKIQNQGAYDDYQYQYRDDTADATSNDDDYQYHYDSQSYEEPTRTTTTTTTTSRPQRRLRGRTRNDYY